MSRNAGRRLLYTQDRVRALVRAMRADAAVSNFETLCELQDLKREIAELREILAMLVATARTEAEGNVARLRHELECVLARLHRRDPRQALH
jgi:hypothetical protein